MGIPAQIPRFVSTVLGTVLVAAAIGKTIAPSESVEAVRYFFKDLLPPIGGLPLIALVAALVATEWGAGVWLLAAGARGAHSSPASCSLPASLASHCG